ncbi:MAG: methyltransferase domain-containing protein [Anaerolineae bacterium]|nr:methyltransferase domain-containing protein [Anaerolineae bacterium]
MRVRNALAWSVAGGAVGVSLAWRFASRRHTLPCPHWLTILLENPFMNAAAGSGAILDRLAIRPGMKLLDVGCGPGRLTLPAAQRVGPTGEVVALDIQPEMLQRVAQKAAVARVTNIRLVLAGAGDGKLNAKLAANGFDRAWLVTVLGEIPDRTAALSEIYRALKPGGLLSITEVLPDPHYQTRRTVRRLAAAVGFEEQSCTGNSGAFTLIFVKPEARLS